MRKINQQKIEQQTQQEGLKFNILRFENIISWKLQVIIELFSLNSYKIDIL